MVQRELGNAKSIEEFFGKVRRHLRPPIATTLEQILEAEIVARLGYQRYEAAGSR